MVDAGPDPVTGKRKQLTRTFGTLREAKAEYASIVHRRYEAEQAPFSQVTVDEWLDQWLAMKAEDLEESTAYSYTMTLARVRGRGAPRSPAAIPSARAQHGPSPATACATSPPARPPTPPTL
ncbi:hypothetical protein ACWEWL_32855 [Streptomyces rochei]